MAQTTGFNIANSGGAVFRSRVNEISAALQSSNAGATAPTATAPGMLWLDTSVTPGILKQRNNADDGWVALLTAATGATAAQGALADLALSATELADFAAGGAGQPRVYGLAIDVSAVTVSAADTYTASEGLSPVSGTLVNFGGTVVVGQTYTNERFSGTMRFKCSHRMNGAGTSTLWLYKNGSIAAGPWTNTTTTAVQRTADVSVAVNDVLEWRHNNVTNGSYLEGISVTASDSLVPVLPTILGSEA